MTLIGILKGGSGSINADSMADPLRNTYLSLPEL